MTPDQLARVREEITREGVMICFNGAFVHSIIEEIGNALRRYLEDNEEKKGAALDVFSVYIEQAQNVRNYLARKSFADVSHSNAIIVIGRKGERYVVSSGNIVDRDDVPDLSTRLDSLVRLDAEGLRRLFKERLRGQAPPQGGAGIGLIEIARRSSETLQYAFHPVDERYRFFCLTATV
jgi:Family of unknown function (DUF6272)